jgi:hypothetical protein
MLEEGRMMKRKPPPIDCVIGEAVNNFVLQAGIANGVACPEELGQMASLRKLLAIGLTAEEAEELDIRQPLLQSVREYARLDDETGDPSERTLQAVNATLKVIADQVQNIELEVQMLNLRKKALKRRARILEKLSESLTADRDAREAA